MGRTRTMQCVSFDDVPGSAGRLRSATVSSVALGADAKDSDNLLVRGMPLTQLAASFAGIIAFWRLDALSRGKHTQTPTYTRWRLDGTLPIPHEFVTTLDIHEGRVAVGTDRGVCVYERPPRTGASWRRVFRKRYVYGLTQRATLPVVRALVARRAIPRGGAIVRSACPGVVLGRV